MLLLCSRSNEIERILHCEVKCAGVGLSLIRLGIYSVIQLFSQSLVELGN
jgi:hypothetical protein